MSESGSGLGRRQFLTGIARRALRGEAFTRWQVLDAPCDDLGVLWGAWGSAPDEVYVVGDDGVVLHWNGQLWERQPSGTKLPLHGVWGPGPGETFAVGWMGVICHRRGGVWRWVQGGEVDPFGGGYASRPQNQPLFGVWGRAPDDVWAVGDHGRIVHFDGDVWEETESGLDTHLRALVGFADGSLLVAGLQGLIARIDGREWIPMEVGTAANITRLWVRGSNDVYAVGGEYDAASNRFQGRAFHYDGARWRELDAAQPLERLRSVSGDGTLTLAVGDRGSLYRIVGNEIRRLASGVAHDLLDLVLFEDSAFSVGDFGTILSAGLSVSTTSAAALPVETQALESPWEPMPNDLTERVLWAVWGHDERNVFAVGENGTVLCYDGHAWAPMRTPTRFHLHAVWGTSPRNVYAVGQQGLVLHYDGNRWSEVHRLAVDVTAMAIIGFGPHEIFVVGDEGLVLTFDGAQWRRVPVATKKALYALWGLDARHLLAVGDFGSVLRFNGERFDEFNAGTENFLYGVWGDALDNVHVVGQSGGAYRFDGRRWQQQPTRQRCDILAVAGRRGHPTLAVGTLGTALFHQGDRWLAEPTDCQSSLRALWMADDGTAFAVGDNGTIFRRR